MAKKEEYHNLKDLQSDELNLEKVIEKIRDEKKKIYGSSCMGGSFSRNWSFQRSTYS